MKSLHRTAVGLVAVSLLVIACTGEDGANGAAGAPGSAGADGRNGAAGADGAKGENGSKGADGQNGTDGRDGADGSVGPEGPPGPGTRWLSFADLGFPKTNEEKHAVRASEKANVDGTEIAIGFHPILRSGQDPSRLDKACDLVASPTTCAGAQIAKNGAVLLDDGGEPLVSNYNDFSSLLEVGASKFLVHSFESNPASIYVTTLSQDAATGVLAATATKNIDMSSVDGLFRTCAGSITPWNTHISAEEAQVDARSVDAATTWEELAASSRWNEVRMMGRYLGLDLTDADNDGNPDIDAATFQSTYSSYFHGYVVEVGLAENGTPTVQKHYAMGRFGMELAYVMPDRKTAFLTDDVGNGGFFMFVADVAGDLSAGTLYAMRAYQTSAPGTAPFSADLDWISLGHATDAEIRALIHPATGPHIKFQDMFQTSPVQAGNTCLDGFTLVRANGNNDALECLRLKEGQDLAASRLETRRFAALKGATAELTKAEGLTYDPDLHRLYIALSDIGGSMRTQNGGADHINVAPNSCGGVFALDVGPLAVGGATITEYAATNWYPLILGAPTSYPAGSTFAGNSCSVSGLGNPDNVTYLPKYQVLMIGEDSGGGHQNDAMWAYHVPSGRLTRMLTTPYGSEVTSNYWVPRFGGRGYLITAVQHPYTESDQGRVGDEASTGSGSWIGVVGPFPALD